MRAARLALPLGGSALLLSSSAPCCDTARPTSPETLSSKSSPWAVSPALFRSLVHEAVGTGLIVALGCGSIASSKFLGSALGLGGIAAVWGGAVATAVYATRDVSGAHLNPAITVALAVHRPDAVSPFTATYYVGAQIFGATLAGVANVFVFGRSIRAFELKEGVIRGSPASASTLGGAFCVAHNACALRSAPGIIAVEALATGLLTHAVFALTDQRKTTPASGAPVMIGVTVASLVAVFGPVSGAGLNPARDLGPRIAALAGGWGRAAFRGAVPFSLGPIIGAVAGGALYDRITSL
jgi:glycerol uptake facilitator protein